MLSKGGRECLGEMGHMKFESRRPLMGLILALKMAL
jgi:hypothetical protein